MCVRERECVKETVCMRERERECVCMSAWAMCEGCLSTLSVSLKVNPLTERD